MTRLTINLKNRIIANAIAASAIPAKREVLATLRADWIDKVILEDLGGVAVIKKINAIEKRFKKATADLPEKVTKDNLFIRNDYVRLNINGMSTVYSFPDGEHRITARNITLTAGNPLADVFLSNEKFYDEIGAEEDNIRANVRAALSEITTIKKLLAIWPEVSELLPEDLAPPAPLLAVIPKDLNKMIGLPSETKAKK